MSKGWDFRSFNERYCSDAIILSLPSVRVILQQCHHSVLALSGVNVDPMAAGYWLLVAGCWLLVTGCWLLVTGCWLLAAGYRGLEAGIRTIGCWLLAVLDRWLWTGGDWTMV